MNLVIPQNIHQNKLAIRIYKTLLSAWSYESCDIIKLVFFKR